MGSEIPQGENINTENRPPTTAEKALSRTLQERKEGGPLTKRGKVLRDTTLGQGLLIVEGQQCPFSREGEWKSESAPKPGQVVDVELDSRGKVRAITVVPDAQLAREQAATAVSSRTKHHDLAFSLVERIGLPSLAAAGLPRNICRSVSDSTSGSSLVSPMPPADCGVRVPSPLSRAL